MSQTWVTLHGCTNLKVTHHQPKNDNCLSLTINRGNSYDGEIEISFFGLPETITNALLAVLEHGPNIHKDEVKEEA